MSRRTGADQCVFARAALRPLCHDAGRPRTTIAHPVTSSHHDVPEEERQKMGITFGLLRISVGLEDPEDLIADFSGALGAFEA